MAAPRARQRLLLLLLVVAGAAAGAAAARVPAAAAAAPPAATRAPAAAAAPEAAPEAAAATPAAPAAAAPAVAARAGRRLHQAQEPPLQRVRLDLGPLRQYWEEAGGFCGELSLQQAGAYYGHWFSQRQMRRLAGGEVLISELEGENMPPLIRNHLGLNFTHLRKAPVDGGGLQRYVVWMKQAVAAGMPVILPHRIEGGESEPPYSYDHLVTLYGAAFRDLHAYDPRDTLTWTTDTGVEVTRGPGDPYFYAVDSDSCMHALDDGGCINASPGTFNYGIAIAGLPDAARLLLPLRLIVTAWADGTPAMQEPRDGGVLGSYSLDLLRAGRLPPGATVTILRFDMAAGDRVDGVVSSGRVLANPASAAALRALCARAGGACRSHSVRVDGPGVVQLPQAHTQLGELQADAVVFFVAVLGEPGPRGPAT